MLGGERQGGKGGLYEALAGLDVIEYAGEVTEDRGGFGAAGSTGRGRCGLVHDVNSANSEGESGVVRRRSVVVDAE